VGHHIREGALRGAESAGSEHAHRGHRHGDIQHGRDAQGEQQRPGHRPGRVARLFGQRDDLVEADEREKHERRAAQQSAGTGPGEEIHIADVGRADHDHDHQAPDLDGA